MALCVKYDKGAVMTYSLIAHSPYEGWRMAINGTNGRLEAEIFESGHKASGKNQKIMFYDRKGQIKEIIVPKSKGGHGGGDERLLRMLFVGDLKRPSWDIWLEPVQVRCQFLQVFQQIIQ